VTTSPVLPCYFLLVDVKFFVCNHVADVINCTYARLISTIICSEVTEFLVAKNHQFSLTATCSSGTIQRPCAVHKCATAVIRVFVCHYVQSC